MNQPYASAPIASPVHEELVHKGETLQLAVVIPTFNETQNVAELLRRLDRVLSGLVWEAIIVDDHSPDHTADAVRALARQDRRVRCLERIGRRGLSTAVIEGVLATAAPVAVVMDADLQHDEMLIPQMYARLHEDALDLVIGSRFVPGGDIRDWSVGRARTSALATRISRAFLRAELQDPMSGYFMLHTALLRELAPRLAGVGFKILLDLFLSAQRPLRFAELGYRFRPRLSGESKLDTAVAFELLVLLYEKTLGRYIPTRFAIFSAVGALGVAVHMATVGVLHAGLQRSFIVAQAVATGVAMTFNFFVNNQLTYRDHRLRGWYPLLRGWLSFTLVCGIGALANVGVAAFLHDAQQASWSLSALGGVVIGAVWNYALSARYTWGRKS